MKHKIKQRRLGRSAHHRRHLFQQLCQDLLAHGSLVTTEAKAKELRRYFEPLVTEAKGELTLHRRRRLLQQLGNAAALPLLLDLAREQAKQPGGALRLARLPRVRSDGAPQVRVDIIRESGQAGSTTTA